MQITKKTSNICCDSFDKKTNINGTSFKSSTTTEAELLHQSSYAYNKSIAISTFDDKQRSSFVSHYYEKKFKLKTGYKIPVWRIIIRNAVLVRRRISKAEKSIAIF